MMNPTSDAPKQFKGDVKSFDRNWVTRPETTYNHWTRSEPRNQIQLAFRNHWTLFRELMGENFKGRRSLEVGCGRGSLSAYFADAGFDCSLLDLSASVIDKAKAVFAKENLPAKFFVGDALQLPFDNESFDVVFSIGLLEHFENVAPVIEEQVRILAPGGMFFGYVVPKFERNVQSDYEWINELLKIAYSKDQADAASGKSEVFRSDALSNRYLPILESLPVKDIQTSGVYPLPMISYSIDFPFSLLNEASEQVLVQEFSRRLERRQKQTGRHPWLCDEGFGQAFLIWAKKE